MNDKKICPLAILHDSKDVMNCLEENCMAWRTTIKHNKIIVGYCIILQALEKLQTKEDK